MAARLVSLATTESVLSPGFKIRDRLSSFADRCGWTSPGSGFAPPLPVSGRTFADRWNVSSLDLVAVFVATATAIDAVPSRCRKENIRNSAECSRGGFRPGGHFRCGSSDLRFPRSGSRSCSCCSPPSGSSSAFLSPTRFPLDLLRDGDRWKVGMEDRRDAEEAVLEEEEDRQDSGLERNDESSRDRGWSGTITR